MTNEQNKQAQTATEPPPRETRYLLEEPYPEEASSPLPASTQGTTGDSDPYDRWGDEALHEARISGAPLPPSLRKKL